MPIRRARSHLKPLLCALGAMLLLLLAPAVAEAETFTVNTTTDGSAVPGEEVCTGPLKTCTLREAIEKANAEPGADTIKFTEVPSIDQKLLVIEIPLPAITEKVAIEGDTYPGATPGVPALELVPVNISLEFTTGFSVHDGTGTRIEGFAIGGFTDGIEVASSEGAQPTGTEICGDYLGVELDGETAAPNLTGIEVWEPEASEPTVKTKIGGPPGCAGNVISGNSQFGIFDDGQETTVAGNSIGIGAQPAGAQLPNGEAGKPASESAGIYVSSIASGTMIGGTAANGEAGNVITGNHGPGVYVADDASQVAIRHDSFVENEGLGIEIATGGPTPPTIERAVAPSAGVLEVEGSVTGEGNETVAVEFFGSPACDAGGAGEGQTYLGVETLEIEAGANPYQFPLFANVPADDTAITATMTRESGATSQFSTCATYVAPPQTFTVTTDEDLSGGGCGATCSLREAIEAANESAALDTIDFAESAEGVIKTQTELPGITEPVEIDGTSAPGYAGRPLVEIDGTETASGEEGLTEGLVIHEGAGGTTIRGIALGGYGYGIWMDGETGSRLCSSWIGVDLGGEAALPNRFGVESGSASGGNEIGVGCGAGAAPNVIAGNEDWGVIDYGRHTEIGGNLIGVGPGGAVMPNGEAGEGGGILVGAQGDGPTAEEPRIGGIEGAVAPNTIAYNVGPGILVQAGFSRPRIRANSIFANSGEGISYDAEAPPAPTISSVTGGSGALTVSGTVSGEAEEEVELDFYASAVCNPLSAGVGETYLGTTEESLGGTPQSYVANLSASISDDELYITVTATGTGSEPTSEFSECFKRPAPEHHEEKKEENHQTTGGGTGNPTTSVTTPTPTNGETLVVKPEEGKVKVKLPGTKKYVPLTELKEIPVGAVIDATKGRVKLTSISPDGTEQTAEFFGGVFKVKQKEGSGLVVLELLDTVACQAPQKNNTGKGGKSPRAFASSVSLRPKKSGTAGKLWGSGHGNFRTEGHDGSATVRGTIWLVEDRCNGTTFFKTRRGIVSVRDFVKHKTLPLPAGKTYLAGEE